MSKIINVILSGGVGSRLWPLSRKSKPKQYLNIFEGKSLIELTIARNSTLVEEMMFVGSVQNIDQAEKYLEGYNFKKIIEATPRNTAAAIAFAAFSYSKDDILLVTPSDHLISDVDNYVHTISEGISFAKQNMICTYGINPTNPETGYGYIEYSGNDVLSFREKPNRETAIGFIKNGNFLWNSGIFCFKAGVYLSELKKYEPELYIAARLAFEKADEGKLEFNLSMKIPSKSIDYAVMERSDKIKVVSSNFNWYDMGSFESLYDYLTRSGKAVDEFGNMSIGEDRHVSFCGLKNTIFVNTEDAILILNKDNAQDVKQIYEALEKENSKLIK